MPESVFELGRAHFMAVGSTNLEGKLMAIETGISLSYGPVQRCSARDKAVVFERFF
jgi:hypothetical protein